MRFFKSGALAALVMGPLAVVQLSGADAHGQVMLERHTVPTTIEPLEQARRVLRLVGGTRLGVEIDDVDAEAVKAKKLSSESGVIVQSVDEDGPASKAGLKAGDVILEFDGERVRSTTHLRRLLQETPAGRKVALSVSRDGQRMSVTVEPDSENVTTWSPSFARERVEVTPRPPRAPRAPVPPRAPVAPHVFEMPNIRTPQFELFRNGELFRDGFAYSIGGGRLGVATQSLGEQLAKHFGVEHGVLVTSVTDNSAAAKAGLRAGDVITKIGSTTVDDTGDLMRAIGDASGEITIDIVRDRKAQTLKATIERSSTRRIRRVM